MDCSNTFITVRSIGRPSVAHSDSLSELSLLPLSLSLSLLALSLPLLLLALLSLPLSLLLLSLSLPLLELALAFAEDLRELPDLVLLALLSFRSEDRCGFLSRSSECLRTEMKRNIF